MEAYSQQIRQEAVRMYRDGLSRKAISEKLQISYKTIRTWIAQYESLGIKGLLTHYNKCGRQQKYSQQVIDKTISYKKDHPLWGAGFILLKLEDDFPGQPLPKQRQLQNYFQKYEVQVKKSKLPQAKGQWAKRAFDRVQVDAKECLMTADKQACCYLNFTDEYTGSDLDAFVFPLRSN